MYMRDVRWGLVKCTSLELGVWLLWNWQFAGLIERSVLLFCDLYSYSLNLRSWREKGWWCVGPRTRGKNSFHAGCQMREAHETGDTDFNWYELVTPAGATSWLMPHQSPIKTPLSLWFSLHVTPHPGILALWCPGMVNMILLLLSHLVISSFDSFSLERRMVQFWARLLSMTDMILWRRPMVPINLRSSIDPSTD